MKASATESRQQAEQIAEQREKFIGDRFGLILRSSLIFAISLILVGAVLSLIQDGHLPTETIPFDELPETISGGDASAILTLGILGLLATPALGLIYLTFAFSQIHERRFSLIALGVLIILIVSLPIGLATRGG